MMNSDAAVSSMSPDVAAPSHPDPSSSSHQSEDGMKHMAAMPTGGHMMSADDPDNPQNWAYHKKIYVSSVAFAFAWAVYVMAANISPSELQLMRVTGLLDSPPIHQGFQASCNVLR